MSDMRMCSLASGSSGNCIYIGSDTTHILVDIGISGKKCDAGLSSLDLKGSDISGVLITHEHSDHIKGLGVFARKYGIPIYATKGTINAIKNDRTVGVIDDGLFEEIKKDKSFSIGDIKCNAMRVSHDAADPVAYRFGRGGKKLAVCTDLGCYDDYTIESLKGMDALLIEANHDIRMLQMGPYPYMLKQRIMSDRGHLSNENSGKLLCEILNDHVNDIILGHLSKENNYPELAFEAVRMEITVGDNPYKANDFRINVAKRDEPSEVIYV